MEGKQGGAMEGMSVCGVGRSVASSGRRWACSFSLDELAQAWELLAS